MPPRWTAAAGKTIITTAVNEDHTSSSTTTSVVVIITLDQAVLVVQPFIDVVHRVAVYTLSSLCYSFFAILPGSLGQTQHFRDLSILGSFAFYN